MTGPTRGELTTPGLVSLRPLPVPLQRPEGLDAPVDRLAMRRAALLALVGGAEPAAMSWSELVEWLIALGRTDIVAGRLCEGHADALRILAQAGRPPQPAALYGVWASRSRGTGVAARADGRDWTLSGRVRFASGVGIVDRALVPVWLDEARHLLVDIAVDTPQFENDWKTPAMSASRSLTVDLSGVRVAPEQIVGAENFYLDRPAFFPGGVGVAAVWLGGAARVADLVVASVRAAPASSSRQVRMGRIRTDLGAAAAVVREAGRRLDEAMPSMCVETTLDWRGLATEARNGVADAVHRILENARTVAGPFGLAQVPGIAAAIDDLDLYVRQRNADSDAEWLGDVGSETP